MKRIVITNAGGVLAIGIARALKAALEPIHLIGVDSNKFMLQRAETDERYLIPRAEEEDYIPVISHLTDETGPDLLFVQLSGEMLPISIARDSLGTRTFLPRHETLLLCDSKMASYERWSQAGVPVPQSVMINTEADLRRAFKDIGNQLWLRNISGTGGKGSLPVSDFDIAKRWIDLSRGWGNFMAAELLEKKTVTWESIWKAGKLVAAQGRKRHFQAFPKLTHSGITGVPGASETVADPHVDEIAVQAITAIDPEPHGILSVDLTYDRHGVPNVTEINAGRFLGGGVAHYASRGINMPYIAVQAALEEGLDWTRPLVNPLPDGIVCIHGMGIEPILTDMSCINSFAQELERRKMALRTCTPAWSSTAQGVSGRAITRPAEGWVRPRGLERARRL